MLAYVLYSLIHAQPCPMKSWHLCDTSAAAICPLDFSVSQRYVQIKDQGSDIPTQTFLKNCLDIYIAKSGGTRHLQGLTARSGNSFNSNLQQVAHAMERFGKRAAGIKVFGLKALSEKIFVAWFCKCTRLSCDSCAFGRILVKTLKFSTSLEIPRPILNCGFIAHH